MGLVTAWNDETAGRKELPAKEFKGLIKGGKS
ncbi:hypothetical protein BH10PSE7_BH10PSE7_18280 [soil metagenome]